MSSRQRIACALTAVNSVASSYFLNYFFFYLHDRFGFGNRENLMVSALHGGIYIFAAWQGGRFAERRGARASLLVGFTGLCACMLAGLFAATATRALAVLAGYTIMLLFTWPALEAIATTSASRQGLPHRVGIYNLTWSAATALAYFTGGPLYDRFGPGVVFTIPSVMFLGQAVYVAWTGWRLDSPAPMPHQLAADHHVPGGHVPPGQPVAPATFLRLAWMANPLSYVAVYTVLAVMPGIAQRLGLSTTEVGLFCSIWLFGRLGAFAGLWRWTGWHYRFRWLAGAYVLLIASFAGILTAPALGVLVAAQVGFGLAAGLIYYSSLFYAMDAGQAQAEHGGLHEAAIGAGICAGPAVGALSLQWFPGVPRAAALGVTGLLVAGFVGLVGVWARARFAARR
jgi:predicted MFS family arabinose efflux permease